MIKKRYWGILIKGQFFWESWIAQSSKKLKYWARLLLLHAIKLSWLEGQWKGRTPFWKLSSNFHTCTVACIHTGTHLAHIHNNKQIHKNLKCKWTNILANRTFLKTNNDNKNSCVLPLSRPINCSGESLLFSTMMRWKKNEKWLGKYSLTNYKDFLEGHIITPTS